MTENDLGVGAVRLFVWLICLMKLKGAVKLPFLERGNVQVVSA